MDIKLPRSTTRVLKRIRNTFFSSSACFDKESKVPNLSKKIAHDRGFSVDIRHVSDISFFAQKYIWAGDISVTEEEKKAIDEIYDVFK